MTRGKLAIEFHNELVQMHQRNGGPRFRKMLTQHGGFTTAIRLLVESRNWKRWWEQAVSDRQWSGIERTVLKRKYRPLFKDHYADPLGEARTRVEFMKRKGSKKL